eukprot:CAMPEP_0198727754 /NCGR_PEP_ID=MMETSP1475-20131203/4995_1 /TAXON_ID= ORGANISM="Unidentified sp., Strain CCMP1999" /NCGR_SAMPLE_ID=MMETSP1475 /ASSEMBLY_ACC=CAM_ASM_001111 /LENGTH=333 /DNA_ID=CAMNT_0044489877 /DNA_START=161 /DNA_END=1162 /DNA_ORIENTATION=-
MAASTAFETLVDVATLYLQLILTSVVCLLLAPVAPIVVLLKAKRREKALQASQVKTVFITGGSSGIGEALARVYAQRKCIVAITGRDPDRLARVQEACRKLGATDVLSKQLNVADAPAMEEFLEEVWSRSPIDVVYANAGISFDQADKTLATEERVRQVIDINFGGTLNTFLPVVSKMADRHKREGVRSKLVVVSSLTAFLSLGFAPIYQTSKVAQLRFAETFRASFDALGIQMTAVMPGWVESNMTRKFVHTLPKWMGTMTSAQAARYIARHVDRGAHMVSFPIHMTIGTSVFHALPPVLREYLDDIYSDQQRKSGSARTEFLPQPLQKKAN